MSEENIEITETIRTLDVVPSPEDSRDWIAEQLLTATTIPSTLDLRSYSRPVRDQGSQGSCAAMAGSAMKEVQENRDCGLTEYLSPQFIYNSRENKPNEGMYMRDLMRILKDLGDCKETTYPYGTTSAISSTARTEAAKYKIQGYASITSIIGLKQALVTNGPAVIAVPVYNYGTSQNNYRIWVQGTNERFLGGHAMAVVGYTTTGFIIRNSWGSSWGNSGYVEFPYSDWGKQWECWTTIDIKTGPDKPIAPKKKTNPITVISRIIRRFLRPIKGNRKVARDTSIPPVEQY